SATTTISVASVDRAPVVTAPEAQPAAVGVPVSFTVTADDPDAESITTLTASGLPAGATFTPNSSRTSGTFSWTPPSGGGAGPIAVTFTAQNALSGSSTTSITVDRPPVVTAPASQSAAENATLTFGVTASDPDGQPITSLSASGLPGGASFTPDGSHTCATF